MLLSPFAGRPIARYGSSRVASGSFVLAAGGLGLEAIAGSLPVLVVGSIVFVTGIAAAVPSLISLIGETVPSARGTAVALYVSILFIGASVGPLLPTSLQSIGFVGLCGLLAVVLLVAAGILVLSRNGSAPQLADNATPGDVE
ncbi:MFS transporter [Halospeciosus flavus]